MQAMNSITKRPSKAGGMLARLLKDQDRKEYNFVEQNKR